MISSGNFIRTVMAGYDIHYQHLVVTWIVVMLSVSILCFIVSELTLNYSQVDKLWSLMPPAYGWIAVGFFPDSTRLWLMAVLVTIWGLRLSFNFWRKGGYNIIPWKGEEDYRWKVMRENPKLKGRMRFGLFNMFFISFYQHFLILLFSSPLILAAENNKTSPGLIDITAGTFMLLFILTETIADNQQFRFQNQKKGMSTPGKKYTESLKKGFLTEGLWSYIRHPNFISEQAIWICFYFFGVAASGNWINWTLSGPVLLVLLFIGSTRLTERISGHKYPDYGNYRKSVPRFISRMLFK